MASGNSRAHKGDDGFRGGLERAIGDRLDGLSISYQYEPGDIVYLVPARNAKYKPDFVLPNGIVIEAKGRFVTSDRQKFARLKEQYPRLDIRFIFSNPNNRISKKSRTTYGMWCDRKEFPFASVKNHSIWMAWAHEPVNQESLDELQHLLK